VVRTVYVSIRDGYRLDMLEDGTAGFVASSGVIDMLAELGVDLDPAELDTEHE
jgi:hypothetical protein